MCQVWATRAVLLIAGMLLASAIVFALVQT